jgi:outer membrane protein assembly factor BamB
VYDPPDLLTANTSSGPVVVAIGTGTVTALDGQTGRTLWKAPTKGCESFFTGPGIIVSTGCSTVDVRDAATGGAGPTWPDLRGATRPVGCAVGRSRCTGLAGNGVPGWLAGPDGTLTPAPALSTVDSWLAGSTVVRVVNDEVTAYDAVTRDPRWSRLLPGAVVLAVEPDVVHLLVQHDIVNLDLASGATRSAIYAHVPRTNDVPWVAGYAYAERGYVVVERVMPGVPSSAPDDAYYYTSPPLVLTGS